MALATQTASTASTHPIDSAAIEVTQADTALSIAPLEAHHIAHLIEENFSPDQIRAFIPQGVRSITEAEARKLGFFVCNKDGRLVSGSGLLLPFTDSFAQLRLDVPIVRKNGGIAKYLTPCKTQAQAMKPADAKVYTEGWKDAQSGSLHGNIATGALAGVSHYRKALKPNSGGTIIFDADGWTNPDVFRSLFNAGLWIGGKINLIPEISDQPKAGLTEYFKAGYTERDYQGLIDKAMKPKAFLLELPKHWKNLPAERLTEAVKVTMKLAVKHLDPMQRSLLIKRISKATGVDRRQIGRMMAQEIHDQNGLPPCKQTQRIQDVEKVWGDRIRFNLLTQKIELDGKPLKNAETVYLDLAEQHQIELPKGEALDIVMRLARQREYHPVRDYLMRIDGTHQGDTSILDNLAQRYFGADDPIFNIYMKKFLIGAVARVMSPGCKLDTVVILQGKQGEQKSAFWSILAGSGDDGSKWFDDSLGDCGDKDEKLKLYRCWFMEWAELEHIFRRKELGAVKSFLTSAVDILRVPYGRSVDEFPRQSVVVGTSNEDDFLADPTGDRRYWVIPVQHEIDLELLKQERDLLWAAALDLYLRGEQWWLTKEEQAISTITNEQWRSDDSWTSRIIDFVKDKVVLKMAEILETALGVELGRQGKSEQMRVATVLKRLGWKRENQSIEGVQMKVWKRAEVAPPQPDAIPPIPPDKEVVQEVSCAEAENYQGFQASIPPVPPPIEKSAISEKTQLESDPVSFDQKNASDLDRGGTGGQGGIQSEAQPELLPPDRLAKAVEMLKAIDSLETFAAFNKGYRRKTPAQKAQIMTAGGSEASANFAVWEQRKAQASATVPTVPAPVQAPSPETQAVSKAAIDPEPATSPASTKSVRRWVYARLPKIGEQMVKVLSERGSSLTVHVSGVGERQISASDVVRESDYTGD